MSYHDEVLAIITPEEIHAQAEYSLVWIGAINAAAEIALKADAEIELLHTALVEAMQCIEECAIFASDDEQKEHDFKGDLVRLRNVLKLSEQQT
jgi:hypothetical protein